MEMKDTKHAISTPTAKDDGAYDNKPWRDRHFVEACKRDTANGGSDIDPSQTVIYLLVPDGIGDSGLDFLFPSERLGYEFVSFENGPPILVIFKKADFPNPFDAVQQASAIYYDREIKLETGTEVTKAKVPEHGER